MTAQPLPEAFADAAALRPPEAPPEAPLFLPVQVLERRPTLREALRRALAGPRRPWTE